jgi:hypothetical protein
MKIVTFLTCLLLFAASTNSQQAANLKDVRRLFVQVQGLSKVDDEVGLSEESLRSFVGMSIEHELPEIEIELTSNDSIRITIMSVRTSESSVASFVSVDFGRYVTILRDEDNQAVGNADASVWEKSAMLAGTSEDMGSKIRDEIGKQIAALATDYHRQNPKVIGQVSRP